MHSLLGDPEYTNNAQILLTYNYHLFLMAMFHIYKVERSKLLCSKLIIWLVDEYFACSASEHKPVELSEYMPCQTSAHQD